MFIVGDGIGGRMRGMLLTGFVLELRRRPVDVVVIGKILDLEEERAD